MSEEKKNPTIKMEVSRGDLTKEFVEAIHERLLQKLASQSTMPTAQGGFSKSGFSKNGFSRSTFSKSAGTY